MDVVRLVLNSTRFALEQIVPAHFEGSLLLAQQLPGYERPQKLRNLSNVRSDPAEMQRLLACSPSWPALHRQRARVVRGW